MATINKTRTKYPRLLYDKWTINISFINLKHVWLQICNKNMQDLEINHRGFSLVIYMYIDMQTLHKNRKCKKKQAFLTSHIFFCIA